MDTLRAFIAIEMPALVADAVRRSRQIFQNEGILLRWVKPGNAHLTLRFLGDIATADIPVFREAMQRSVASSQPFSLKLSGIGAFPGLKRPKAIWLGVTGQLEGLNSLYRNLSIALAEQGIPLDKRPFKGHLTIGRVKGRLDPGKLRTVLSRLASFETDDFDVDSIHLFKSDLTPKGAIYTPLVQMKL